MTPAVVMRPILLAEFSVNQRAPSDPTAMPIGPAFAVGMLNSLRMPDVVIRPMRSPAHSVNQSAPSGPATMRLGERSAGTGYSVMVPVAVILPILLREPLLSTNHSAPSGPVVIPWALASGEGMGNPVTEPDVVIRPILLPAPSVNQSAPSGPAVMLRGSADDSGRAYSAMVPTW
jgi:hypothetical protein